MVVLRRREQHAIGIAYGLLEDGDRLGVSLRLNVAVVEGDALEIEYRNLQVVWGELLCSPRRAVLKDPSRRLPEIATIVIGLPSCLLFTFANP